MLILMNRLSKIAVAQLLERVRLLENTLNAHKIPIPSFPPPQATPRRYNTGEKITELPEFLEDSNEGRLTLFQEDTATELSDTSDRERALIKRIDQGHSLTPGLDPEMELLVKRTGSLQFTEQGQLKYFGTTSNVHFLKTATPFQTSVRGGQYDETPEMWLERAGLGQNIPREMEDHLIKLYFTWQNPYFHVVDQKAFMDARNQAISAREAGRIIKSSCYSELLVNAMSVAGYVPFERLLISPKMLMGGTLHRPRSSSNIGPITRPVHTPSPVFTGP